MLLAFDTATPTVTVALHDGTDVVSDGGPKPYRVHFRAPSFVNLQSLPHMAKGRLVADLVALIASLDPVLGDVDR